MGVTLFFILSGFVLYYSSYKKNESKNYKIGKFYFDRFARIVPLVYFLSGVYLLKDLSDGSFDTWYFFLFLQSWSPDIRVAFSNLAVAWSLSVEMFLYLCFPLVFLLSGRLGSPSLRSGLLFAVVGMAIPLFGSLWFEFFYSGSIERAAPFGPHYILYRLPLMRIGDFLLGIGLAQIYFSCRDWRWGQKFGAVLLALGSIVLVTIMATVSTESAWTYDTAWLLPASAIILGAALFEKGALGRGWGWSSLLVLGRASFAFYLVHQAYVLRFFDDLIVGPQGEVLIVPSFILALLIGVVVAIALHYFVEQPCQKVLKHYYRKTGSYWLRKQVSRP